MTVQTVGGGSAEMVGSPELVVITKPDAAVGVTEQGIASDSGAATDDLAAVLAEASASMHHLFSDEAGNVPSSLNGDAGGTNGDELGLAHYFTVDVDPDRMEEVAARLAQCESVDAAYVKPPAEPATILIDQPQDLAPAVTPDYRSRQNYLDAAPVGIDADYAWSLAGGKGAGVTVVDCEWGWNLDHEDLLVNNGGVICGSSTTQVDFENHGTAVWGEIGGDHNGRGVMGIAPDSELSASSFVTLPTSKAIKCAADKLTAGDIILLEVHRSGPNDTTPPPSQQGYIAIEWWPDDFAAIRYAVNKGIIVVEAAGNGWENLDDAAYNTPAAGFPPGWKNPFNTANPTSGAVMVGAGSPPPGTHGRNTSPWNLPYVDRARCGFSNWGSRVDAQGWGWEVTSTGYGTLQGGIDRDKWYTDTFSGTSSASPIVTGALASTQGVLKAKNMPLMDSHRARTLLRQTGSPQQPAPGRPTSQRIGNRPSLKQLIPAALKTWVSAVKITYCYALTNSQYAWAYVDGIGWRRIKNGNSDGVANVFEVCCNVQAAGAKANVYIDDQYLYNIVQL